MTKTTLRPKIAQLIQSVLENNSSFTFHDFDPQILPGNVSGTVLKIIYKYEPKYYIRIELPETKSSFTKKETNGYGFPNQAIEVEYSEFEVKGAMVPGTLSSEEQFSYKGSDGIIISIKSWLRNLWEDLIAAPELRSFNA